jgi:hypothetical protein
VNQLSFTIQELKSLATTPGVLYIAAWYDIGVMAVFSRRDRNMPFLRYQDTDKSPYMIHIDVFDSEFNENVFDVYTENANKSGSDWFPTGGKDYSKFSGSIKWDGCSDWGFEDCNQVMTHFCGYRDLEKFSELLKRCYQIAWTLMPGGDKDDFVGQGDSLENRRLEELAPDRHQATAEP